MFYSIFFLSESSFAMRTLVVTSDGMAPSIRTNDLIEVDDNSAFNGLNIGDIIVFTAPNPTEENKTIVSRITAIVEKGNNLTGNVILCAPIAINEVIQEKTMLTKGDGNECSIPGIDFPITEDYYIGKVEQVSNSIGLEKKGLVEDDGDWIWYKNASYDISFQYPDNWKLTHSGMEQPLITLSNVPYTDTIAIGISDHNETNIFENSSLLDYAEKNFTDNYAVTIVEPFVEKTINGIPSVVGRIAEDKLLNDEIQTLVKDIVLMEDKDTLHKIEYSDNVNNYNEAQRDEIWKRFILSFNLSP
jgi:signal peptidase I